MFLGWLSLARETDWIAAYLVGFYELLKFINCINQNHLKSAKELQRALWTDPPAVRIMPGIPRSVSLLERLRLDCDSLPPQEA